MQNGEIQELGPRHTLRSDELMDPPTSDIGFPLRSSRASGHGAHDSGRGVGGSGPTVIEHQLAHAVRDSNGRTYNRTGVPVGAARHDAGWADYLDRLRAGKIKRGSHSGRVTRPGSLMR